MAFKYTELQSQLQVQEMDRQLALNYKEPE